MGSPAAIQGDYVEDDLPPKEWMNRFRFYPRSVACLIWPFYRDKNGYAMVSHGGRYVAVSRFMCEQKNGFPPTAKHETAHNCGNGHLGCVNPNHLRWATRKENQADRIIHGTGQNGEHNHQAKLTADQVLEIRAAPGTNAFLAGLYAVDAKTISMIKNRKRWGWL